MAFTSLTVEKLKIVGIQLGSSGLSDLFPEKENVYLYESPAPHKSVLIEGLTGTWDFSKMTPSHNGN